MIDEELRLLLVDLVKPYKDSAVDLLERVESQSYNDPSEEGLRILQALRDALGELDEARDELAALMATRFGVSVREIAKASGVSTATLYRRIDTTKKNDRTGS